MSDAMRSIVDAYVALNDREALERLQEHRQRLKRDLQVKSGEWFDVSRSTKALDDELNIIEAGLARL
jgi:hypothetical protein